MHITRVASLRHADCQLNQRAGVITVIDGKGKKSRTLDLHNKARRALYDYLQEPSGSRDAATRKANMRLPASALHGCDARAGLTSCLRGELTTYGKAKQRATQEDWTLIQDITFHDLRHDFAHRTRAAGWRRSTSIGATFARRTAIVIMTPETCFP